MFHGNQGNILKSETLISTKQSSNFDIEKDTNMSAKTILPIGHAKYTEADKEKCPFFKFSKDDPNNTTSTAETNTTKISQDKEIKKNGKIKKIKGGCPFMPSGNTIMSIEIIII